MSRKPKRARPVPPALAAGVPPPVREKLRKALFSRREMDETFLADLFERFRLREQYGLSWTEYRLYAKAIAADAGKFVSSRSEYPPSDAPATKFFRQRLQRVGSLVSRAAVDLSTCAPEEWGRGAHLALLGHVYMRLMEGGEDMELTELRELSRIIAEQRRAQAQASVAARRSKGKSESAQDDHPPTGHRPLPDNFAEVVRELYGTTLQRDFDTAADGET